MAEEDKTIPEDFLLELFKACIDKRNVFESVRQHLKMHYISDSSYKKVWKQINSKYLLSNGKSITLGALKLDLRNDFNCIEILSEIQEKTIEDYSILMSSFEDYLKQKMFIILFKDSSEFYNKGSKEKAYLTLKEGAEKISNFNIRDKYYERVFKDFSERQTERTLRESKDKIPTNFDELDLYTFGGFERGDAVLWVGDSGVGKSQLLIHLALAASRRRYKCGLIVAEGTRKQLMDRIDAAWTGTIYNEMKLGNINHEKYEKYLKIAEKMIENDILIECYEKFNSSSIVDVRNTVIEWKKMYGDLAMLGLDYFELFEPGDDIKYQPNDERFRQKEIGRAIKNLAVEQNLLIHVPTQASSISPTDLNDPDFFMTRYNLSEDKGKLRPFDGLITMNQTRDEKRNKVMRLYADKLREYESGQIMYIVQNLSRARFYDRKKTLDLLSEMGITEDEN